jgi:hypothetical protein
MSNKWAEIVNLDFAVLQTCIGSFGKKDSNRNSLGCGDKGGGEVGDAGG